MRTINLEFYGLPGSGKSTISHQLAIKLRNKGYKVVEPSYNIDNKNHFVRKMYKLIKCIQLIIFKRENFYKVIDIIQNNGYKGISALRQLSNIAYKLLFYINLKQNTIYIWDEGLLQSAISLSYLKKENIEKNLLLCNIVKANQKRIYVNVNNSDAINRIKKRNKHHSRVEKSNQDISLLIEDIHYCCSKVKSNIIIKNDNFNNIKNEIDVIIKKLNIM